MVEICSGNTIPFAKEGPRVGMQVALAVDKCPVTVQEARQAIPPDGPWSAPEVREYDITDMRKLHLMQEFDVLLATTPCQPWSGSNRPGTASPDCLITCTVNLLFATRTRFLDYRCPTGPH